ncbi:MAG: hypothetical protein V1916_03445 [Patescibacteria group bacterium]
MAPTNTSFAYRHILRQAFDIVKRHRYLWFFGFFATLLGAGGELQPLFNNYSTIGERSQSIMSLRAFYEGGVFSAALGNAKLFFESYPWQALFFFLMIGAIFLVAIWLAIVSQVALFDAAAKLAKGKATTYAEGYQAGNRHFSSVLLINVVLRVILYGVFLVVAMPLLTWFLVGGNLWGGIVFVLLLFFVLLPAAVIVSFMVKFAIAYVVINGLPAKQAVRQGWELFKRNWLASIEMAIIILLIGLVVGLAILIVMGLASVPFILIGIAALFFGTATGFAAAVTLCVITWFAVAAIMGSAYVAYQYTAWTLLFVELDAQRAQSKLMRWFGKVLISN